MSDTEKTAPPGTSLPADAPWWARWMVDNARECWRWLSTWMIAAAAAAPMLYENIGALQSAVSPSAYHYIQSALVALIFLGRIKKQG